MSDESPDETPAESKPAEPSARRPGWIALHEEPLPRPTAWPLGIAFSVTFLLWGIVSSPFITYVGGGLLVISIAGWIGELRHET